MFKSSTSTQATDYDVIIGSKSELNGDIVSEGSVRVEGVLNGNITTDGVVIIGTDAKVEGDIESSNIEISGQVKGDILSQGLMKIYKTGSLVGNITVASFQIDEGGSFEGQCHINIQDEDNKDNVLDLKEAQGSND